MLSDTYLNITQISVCAFEYTCLLIYILLHIRSHKSHNISHSPLQQLYLALLLLILTTRIVSFPLIFYEDYLYKVLLSINYLATFCLYTFIGYYWYYSFRVSVLLKNCYHISAARRKTMLKSAKMFKIGMDLVSWISFIVIAGIYYDELSYDIIGPPSPESSIAMKIHLFCSVWVVYILLMMIGISLLKLIRKYYTEKPLYLILSLYVILVGFTYSAISLTLPMFLGELFTDEAWFVIGILYVNLVDILPQIVFHKQVVVIQPKKTTYVMDVMEPKSFLDELVD